MLTLNNVTITFENQNILENINLEVKKGEIISIIGPSGSGKSTLIRCMNHMVVPSNGYVSFKDEILTEKNIDEIRQHIGMVFQAFELFPHLTVLENLFKNDGGDIQHGNIDFLNCFLGNGEVTEHFIQLYAKLMRQKYKIKSKIKEKVKRMKNFYYYGRRWRNEKRWRR